MKNFIAQSKVSNQYIDLELSIHGVNPILVDDESDAWLFPDESTAQRASKYFEDDFTVLSVDDLEFIEQSESWG